MRSSELAVGSVPCLALRVTYVGELGWELYCPSEFGLALWDAIWASGADHGLVAGGYKAIDSLRLEKGYRVWGADITPDDTPFEAGLGFAVKLDKGEFIGRDALAARREPERRLCCLTLADPRAVALGSEPVRVGGEPVGRVTSGGYGYTVERSIAYAYLPAERATPGQPRRGGDLRRVGRRRGRRRSRSSTPRASGSAHDRERRCRASGPSGVESIEPLGGGITNHNFKVDGRRRALRAADRRPRHGSCSASTATSSTRPRGRPRRSGSARRWSPSSSRRATSSRASSTARSAG